MPSMQIESTRKTLNSTYQATVNSSQKLTQIVLKSSRLQKVKLNVTKPFPITFNLNFRYFHTTYKLTNINSLTKIYLINQRYKQTKIQVETNKMKVLVGIKRVIDYTSQKIKIKDNNVDLTNTRMYINPFCEIAMQQAANLKAKKVVKQIVALSIGPKGQKKVLWTPLAIGADKAIYVNTDLRHDTALQPIIVAQTLKHFVQKQKIDLVILGKQSVDDDCNQTGQILAGLLNWPQATFASKIQIKGDQIEVTRQVDTGLETIRFKGPAVITCDLRLNLPKIASLPQMMKAKKTNIEEVELNSLGIQPSKVQILETYEPAKKKGGVMVKSVDELIEKLQKQAKII